MRFRKLTSCCVLFLALSVVNAVFAVIEISPDETGDCTQKIDEALAAARHQKTYVLARAGTYFHSGMLTVSGVELRGVGDETIFCATNPKMAAIRLTGVGAKLSQCMVMTSYAGKIAANSPDRLANPEAALIWVVGASTFAIDHVFTRSGRSAGILINGAHGIKGGEEGFASITHCKVQDTLADGIHMTNGSHSIRVVDNVVSNVGDDCIAVVSYKFQRGTAVLKDEEECRDITVRGNQVGPNVWGRGLSVVGGGRVSLIGNTVSGAFCSGVYLLSEDSYQTYSTHDILVQDNLIQHSNSTGQSGHQGICIAGRKGFETRGITIQGNRILNSVGNGILLYRFVQGVTISDNLIDGATGCGILMNGAKDVEVKGRLIAEGPTSVIKNTGGSAIYVDGSCAGYLKILSTQFEQTNKSANSSGRSVVFIGNSPELKVTLTGNHYRNPGSTVVERYIECQSADFTTPIIPPNTRESEIMSRPTVFCP